MHQDSQRRDSFGNPIDPVVGFARGSIIRSSTEETQRLRNGQAIGAARVRRLGPESVTVFTGNQRDFPVRPEDLATYCEEWVGPGLLAQELQRVGVAHMGGRSDDAVAVFNRTSAGIIATIAALSEGRPVVSVVPAGGRSHASVVRGCAIAGVNLAEIQADKDWQVEIERARPALVIVTTVTSSLEFLEDNAAISVSTFVRQHGACVFLDEAYGARMRPVLRGGAASLALGADLSITNCDKAGLSGPRAGVLVGRPILVTRASAKGSEFGMEARAPIATGALRSLERYSPADLIDEAESGRKLALALQASMGPAIVAVSDLGPMIDEEAALREVFRRASKSAGEARVVPCEVTSAIGVVLLRDHGILTVNTHGQPGARVSVRLKPTAGAIDRAGGIAKIVRAVDSAFDAIARIANDVDAMAALILGDLR